MTEGGRPGAGSRSRLPGLHRHTLQERRALLTEASGLPEEDVSRLWTPTPIERLALMTEDVVGVFELPLSVAPNLRVNDRDHLIPLVTEESSVVAALAHGARLLRDGEGVRAQPAPPLAVAQVFLDEVPSPDAAMGRVAAAEARILAQADASLVGLTSRGGGARQVSVRALAPPDGRPALVVEIEIDVVDAMGANLAVKAGEALQGLLEALTGGRALAAIVSNAPGPRVTHARGVVPVSRISPEVADRIARLSRLAEADPGRATTHNKGILNGVCGVLLATGQDYRALEAAAHVHACRDGVARPLSRWERRGDELVGDIALPTPVGTAGGATSAHPKARACLELCGARGAGELSAVLAAVGLAQNLAALKALVDGGLLAGHMRLHATNLALALGASPEEAAAACAALAVEAPITSARVREALDAIRARQ
jgi:hydroxymethylglutaryl-CoA reductase